MSEIKPAIVGVMDEDPFHHLTWSGSSRFFFNALKQNGTLVDAFGAEPGALSRRIAQVRNIDPDMEKWKFKYHLDTGLYSAMSKQARRQIKSVGQSYNTILQVGAWYDLVTPDVCNVSYHDGNLAALLSSPFGYPDISKSVIKRALDYERDLYNRLDLIFPMSAWLAGSFIKDFGADKDKVIPVGAGINLPRILDTENRTYHSKKILMVGKAFERKGGDTLLKAFKLVRKQIPDASLHFIGPELEGLPDGVSCSGYLDKNNDEQLQELLQYYLDAQVFALPSLYEPFGISFVEAMAHRVPCIGTNICAMPEIISHESSGYLVDPGDHETLARYLVDLLISPEKCAEFGNAGFERYQKNYTWEIVTNKIIDAVSSRLT